MPEFFGLILIVDNKKEVKKITKYLADMIGLHEGKNNIHHTLYPLLAKKEVIVCTLDNAERYFDEICIDLADQVFHKQNFEKELEQLTEFVYACFQGSNHIAFVVCGYETNNYYLEQVEKIEDMDGNFLSKFPIVYIQQPNAMPLMIINHEAQDIFATFDAIKFNP